MLKTEEKAAVLSQKVSEDQGSKKAGSGGRWMGYDCVPSASPQKNKSSSHCILYPGEPLGVPLRIPKIISKTECWVSSVCLGDRLGSASFTVLGGRYMVTSKDTVLVVIGPSHQKGAGYSYRHREPHPREVWTN